MQQIYEKKINYLNTKIQLLTEESKQKDIVLQNLKNASSENQFEQQDKIQDLMNLGLQKQKMEDQQDKEIQKVKHSTRLIYKIFINKLEIGTLFQNK
ncbi:unnamed protein product [Paramecium octaurelia]|uniref:Uncharacterized protein n=1 Tax=Paramecium octaurelia TaxID=43137 RepID=A0A8S1XLK8_PAROT|nr:unnamed protein product [Paramecium octaurelia]